ncbi:hypothetical protein GCM10023084_24380 [Streptomyces lacrimifluminis]|uniref:Carrier domain-containing protein n=1 Tax=Streptomyces lacrimifluminis TaxID=1500077 RepID=A0A917NNY2_9ACTN|nr:acyl carrier protein [Streptomyces lacrimifluminis]GGJ14801.1 hypothetical protein GCM10012282_08880 [Streptomyces lacrimifluminis]
MAGFTLTEFRKIVEACYEGADAEALDGSALNTDFSDLGYDSIVMYEIAMRIQDDFPVTIPDERLDDLRTPAAMIAFVDAQVKVA